MSFSIDVFFLKYVTFCYMAPFCDNAYLSLTFYSLSVSACWTGVLSFVVVVYSLRPTWLFVTPYPEAHQTFLSVSISQSLLIFMSIDSMMLSNHLILCHSLLPSVSRTIRVFNSESTLLIRWWKYWCFSFSIISNIIIYFGIRLLCSWYISICPICFCSLSSFKVQLFIIEIYI